MASISVTDSAVNEATGDRLGTADYARTLAKFIRECQTPLTIGIQGEWGSGKTSLLNMIQEDLKEQVKKKQGGAEVRGHELYKTIWVNTWEHSLLKSPEETLLSIIEEIIDEIAIVDGSYNAAARAKSALGKLAKGGLRAAATLSMGAAGAEIVKDLVEPQSSANSVKELRRSLENIIDTVINRQENKTTRFVVFVDDLDRLDPERAVEVLELLKNIFTIKDCVFVLAIDYQVVVKGLRGKFGEQTEQNEYEFRAFFDKIIQLPFMMPMAQYDLDQYINHLLVDEVRFFEKSQRALLKGGTLGRAVRLTLGTNPRSLKRLLNSLSLLDLTEKTKAEKKVQDKGKGTPADVTLADPFLRQIVFILVCCQISFPKIYELLLRRPLFTQWDEEFVKKVTGGPHQEDSAVEAALQRALEVNQEDFDEPWEEALFKIVWLKKWQRKRLVETSRLLSLICDQVVPNLKNDPEQLEKHMISALKITAVTAVSSTEEGVFASEDGDDDNQELHDKVGFWKRFASTMKGTGSIFDPDINAISPIYKASGISRKLEIDGEILTIHVAANSTSPLVIAGFKQAEIGERFYTILHENREQIEGCSPHRVIWNKDSTRPTIVFRGPADVKARLVLFRKENEADADKIFKWLAEIMSPLENAITQVISEAHA